MKNFATLMIIFSRTARVTVETCACCCTVAPAPLFKDPSGSPWSQQPVSRAHTHSTEVVIKRIANVHTSLCNLFLTLLPCVARFLTPCASTHLFSIIVFFQVELVMKRSGNVALSHMKSDFILYPTSYPVHPVIYVHQGFVWDFKSHLVKSWLKRPTCCCHDVKDETLPFSAS